MKNELHLLVYLPCYNYTQKKEGANAPQVPQNLIHITSDLVCYGVKGGIIIANKLIDCLLDTT